MQHDDVLTVLESDEALHGRFTGGQLLSLSVFTLIIPVIALIAVGSSLA
ncbi:hypothetical protein [Ruicaihuangia caeni]|uniref:Uncharacterized protein n=1 Tax=Ruicaihuangia caeni TaxID=3042517 RepID=A0AAW6TAG1_9MICO|nr:hypothetical protein [Klugiella sp. YN-L-19]MDI2098117.1 hypothetical protein [Klugiella sp. YN-L-19]